MTTVIDELVVTLGLDPSKFTKGQREALDQFRKDQEAFREGGKKIEDSSRRTTQSLGAIKNQALEMFATLTGGTALIQFQRGIINSDAAVGRLSRNLGQSVADISKWQGAARLTNGSAEQMAATFTSISDAIKGFQVGVPSPLLAQLRQLQAAGGVAFDPAKLNDVNATLLTMAANLERIHARDPALAGLLGRQIGLDPGLFDLLVRGEQTTAAVLDHIQKIGTATKESAEAAGDLQARWQRALQTIESFGHRTAGAITTTADFLNLTPRDAVRKLLLQIPGAKDLEGRPPSALGVPLLETLKKQSGLPIKPGSGDTSVATLALARELAGIPGLDRFTSFNDAHHGGAGAHGRGQALDFTLKDAAKSAEVATAVRERLKALGVDATVLDEYAKPSPFSTGGHIHVQFNGAEAAAKYAALAGRPDTPGAAGGSTVTTTIGTLVVNSKADDAAGIAGDIRSAIERQNRAASANYGAN